jgi:hypothetical protein
VRGGDSLELLADDVLGLIYELLHLPRSPPLAFGRAIEALYWKKIACPTIAPSHPPISGPTTGTHA